MEYAPENQNDQFYLHILNKHLEDRRLKNPRYSLRAYANYLDFDSSTLSKIINKKRNFPLSRVLDISKKLNLTDREVEKFANSVVNNKRVLNSSKKDSVEWQLLDDDLHYKVIADWEYYTLLNVCELENFENSYEWISKKTGISIERAYEVINDLLELSLLKENTDGSWIRTHKNLMTSDETSSKALKEAHKQELLLAIKSIEEIPLEYRGLYSVCVVTNPKAVKKAKKMTAEFIDKLIDTLEKGPKQEVYQVGTQFIPLTMNELSKSFKENLNKVYTTDITNNRDYPTIGLQ